VIAAVISGAEGWEAIETFGEEKLEWLRKYFPFANGVPSHDCIRMVMISLSPKALRGCFARWMQAVAEVANGEVGRLTARRCAAPSSAPGGWGRFTW
jgi:DDE family transposase